MRGVKCSWQTLHNPLFLRKQELFMTKRQEMTALLDGRSDAGMGSIFWKHFGADEQLGDRARAAHDAWIAGTEPAFVKVMNEQLYPHEQEFQSSADWAAVEPYPPDHPHLKEQWALVKELVDAYSATHHVFATVHGLTASAFHARGGGDDYEDKRGQLADALREDEELVGSKLKVIGQSLVDQVEDLMTTGIDGVFLAALGGESTNFTDEEFAQHVRPWDVALLEAVGTAGGLRYLHICKEDIVLDRYDGYPVDFVQVATHLNDISMDDMRRRFPDAVVVGGVDNLDSYFLGRGDTSPEAMSARAIAAITEPSRFLIGADCSLPNPTSPDVVGALSRAAHSAKA